MSFWRDRNVFVTGCTGFLGHWLTTELVGCGAHVVGLIRDLVPEAPFFVDGLHHRLTTVRGELEDYALLERSINEYEVDCVFHLAAQAIVGAANRNPLATFETNIRGTWNLLEACRRNPTVSRIVVASSDKAYGIHAELPYTEQHPLQGTHPYDVSKSCADLIAAAYHHTYGSPVCSTRCGNLYGPGDLNFSRIVPGTIRSALLDDAPIIRSDGSPLRDYVYVKNIAAAYLLLAEKMDDQAVHGLAFNFGTEKPLSVLDLTMMILREAGSSDLEPVILDEVKSEIPDQYLSSDLAKDRLGWCPDTELTQNLGATVAWYREYLARASPEKLVQ